MYAALKDMIAVYRFAPGVRMNVENLVRELGVSRVPVWEAIRRLEQEGLLQTIKVRQRQARKFQEASIFS